MRQVQSLGLTRPQWTRVGALLSVYFLGSYLVSRIALIFSPSPEPALIYPGVSLDLALPLVFGLAYAPALLFAPFVGAMLATLFGTPTLPILSPALLGYALIKFAVYGGAAWFLLRVMKIDTRLSKLRDVSWFLFIASFVAPFFAAVLNEVDFYLLGFVPWADLSAAMLTFWAGDATGVAMLAPLLLTLQSRGSRLALYDSSRSRLVFASSLAFLLLATWFAYARPNVGRLDYSYLIFVPLVLIAVRCGFRRTAFAVFLLNMSVVIAVNYRLTDPEVIALQFNLMAASYLSLLLAGVFEEYYRSRERLRYTAYHDALTGLPNRAQFLERLAQLSHEPDPVRREPSTYAIIFLDLDRFKRVNDAFGHTVGDALLRELAQRLTDCLRPGDVLARLGGDEFAVLMSEVNSSRDALAMTQCLSEHLDRPNHAHGYDLTTRASIGVALGTVGEVNAADVLRNADTAMHEAKLSGQTTLFDEVMERRLQEWLGLERDLKAATRGDLSVAYQPIVALNGSRAIGSEALMRWRHPTKGEISPEVFIPIAEETGLIHELGEWLLYEVLAEAKDWRDERYVAVNLSVKQLQRRGFVLKVKAALDAHQFPPERLVLEVTESIIMADLDANVAILDALASLGIRIAMDDFGTGYASLSYLKRLPVHIMKIDRSFLSGVPSDSGDATLVRTILAMAHSLNLKVVAEGVETQQQETFLLAHGCEHAQGFFYGKPVALQAQPRV